MNDLVLGAYRILSELGTGGMGKVFLAEALEDGPGVDAGGNVALKVIHRHLLESPGLFKRFLQEADLGKRVRHENVVRTYDVDVAMQDGQPIHYIVMEFVEGRSLNHLLLDLGTIPETLLREIALQTAAGLIEIHREGIVHRDLKPENIILTHSDRIRIMDLGVAKLQEATIAITRQGQFAGTILYAAPEQFGLDEVGSAADLYSLGVMLHELATGENPFRRDSPGAVIEAHLRSRAPLACEVNGEISRFFSECIATLLSKEPSERFESAAALHAVLERGEQSPWWTDRAPQIERQHRHLPKIRVRRETQLHGRGAEMETLADAWRRAQMGEGNAVFIEGEAGIGKTRLIDAFLRDVGQPETHILYGAYPPSGGMGGISNAVLEKFGEVGLADALRPYLSITPSLVPGFVALVKHESPPAGSEPLRGEALCTVCVHLMRALAEERPVIWIVENLDFATSDSRNVALALARGLEGRPVLLLASARPGITNDELAHFSRLPNFERLCLPRLGARDVFELLEEGFRSEILAEQLGGKIARKSDGVPFFIFEMIRELKDGQFVKQLPNGSYVQTRSIDDLTVPTAVKDLIEGRLLGLTESQRAILDVGAVQGLSFEPALAAEILEEKRVKVLRELAEVERRHGLVRGEAGRTHFDQNQIQEVLYGDLTPDLRAEYHTLLAESYAGRCDDEQRGDDAHFLASHHLRGSEPKLARPYIDRALEHLERSYLNDELIDLTGRALDEPGLLSHAKCVEVMLRKADRLDLLGRRGEQRATLDEAVALADMTGDAALRARARRSIGGLLFALSRFEEAQAVVREALELAQTAGDRELEARARGNLGVLDSFLGHHAEAREHHERAIALSREVGDEWGEAIATGSLGIVYRNLRETGKAREHFERHLALSRKLGNRAGEANATGNLGLVFLDLGQHEEARRQFEQHREMSRALGNRRGEAIATGNLGSVFRDQGLYADARGHFERHRVLCRELGNRQGESMSRGNLGQVDHALGRLRSAREHFERHREMCREFGDRRGEAHAAIRIGSVLRDMGRPDEARRLLEEALGPLRELDAGGLVAEALVLLARIDWREKEPDHARAHLDEAIDLARESNEPSVLLAATVARARLPDGGSKGALTALEENEDRTDFGRKMDTGFRLWKLTGDRAHLDRAWHLLEHLREHAPEEDKDSMIENVPLHEAIRREWTDHGAR